MAVNSPGLPRRNPGPWWGYWFLQQADRRLPRWIFRPALMLGTRVALAFMAGPRRHSRAFLSRVLGRPARLGEVARHFQAFADLLVLRLRVARGAPHRCRLAPEHAAAFDALVDSGQPALFGTFHFGRSDLLGFMFQGRGRHLAMVRHQVGNSDDTDWLGRLFGRWVSFIWVNDPGALPLVLKEALEAGHSLAMQCDRTDLAGKVEAFPFLGKTESFPFAIYHLALLFHRPVIFCVGLPDGDDATLVLPSPVFTPDAAGRAPNLERARAHFAAVLAQLETLVRQHPMLWFNFRPLQSPGGPEPA
jgi:predicted LPLAT superfamily acyltransferase